MEATRVVRELFSNLSGRRLSGHVPFPDGTQIFDHQHASLMRQQAAQIAVHQDFTNLVEVTGQGHSGHAGVAEGHVFAQQERSPERFLEVSLQGALQLAEGVRHVRDGLRLLLPGEGGEGMAWLGDADVRHEGRLQQAAQEAAMQALAVGEVVVRHHSQEMGMARGQRDAHHGPQQHQQHRARALVGSGHEGAADFRIGPAPKAKHLVQTRVGMLQIGVASIPATPMPDGQRQAQAAGQGTTVAVKKLVEKPPVEIPVDLAVLGPRREMQSIAPLGVVPDWITGIKDEVEKRKAAEAAVAGLPQEAAAADQPAESSTA